MTIDNFNLKRLQIVCSEVYIKLSDILEEMLEDGLIFRPNLKWEINNTRFPLPALRRIADSQRRLSFFKNDGDSPYLSPP